MRALGPALLIALLLAGATADEVVLDDGTIVDGTLESLTLRGQAAIPAHRIADVHIAGSRTRVDAAWIERLLRFAVERARRGVKADSTIGVYIGRGVSAPSALAVVRRLDAWRRPPRLLLEGDVTRTGLAGLRTLVVPGGWAPSQLTGLGKMGQSALERFVLDGGHYLGICAGGYLPCSDVVWKGERVSYPVRLVDGTAAGPVPGRAAWPTSEVFALELPGRKQAKALYAGGSSFAIAGARVLATYPGGAAAAVLVKRGQGRLLLTGAHVEFDGHADRDLLAIGGWAAGLEPGDASVLRRFLEVLGGR